MNTYKIINRRSGVELGQYTAESAELAHDSLVRDAGYGSVEDMADRFDVDVESVRGEVIITVV